LKNAPETARVEAFTAHARGAGSAELLRTVRENPAVLVSDPTKELRTFRVALDKPLGAKRGRGRGSFIDSILDAVEDFYAEVLQNLRAWAAAPPKVRDVAEEPPQPVPPALVSTSLSSQDGPEEVVDPSGSNAGGTAYATAQVDHHVAKGGDDAPRQWAEAAAELTAPRPDDGAGVGDANDTSEDAREAAG
jgi:hypothetical protein